MIILLNNMIVKSKTCVWWLKVWLNRKLNFKVHVQTKIATVARTLHSLFKLMNSEWELNVKSEKQLYLTCITSISDYDVEIWWNNQKSYLVKFCKLQNAALWKILSVFWTSSIDECYANRSRNLVDEDAIKSKVQELCNLNSWIIEKTLYQKKNVYFILVSILYWIESRSERIEISELKWDEEELILKSQEVQRQTHADILNIEQSAKNIELNKRNRNFSLQEIVRSRNQAFSKNSNQKAKLAKQSIRTTEN